MKMQKQRVIAIDFFRGVCILAVILNHAALFSLPFAYISGDGSLWTSAAEMFLLLSGVTYAIVRGDKVRSDFGYVLKRTWRRAGIIYLVNISIVIISLLLALFLTSRGLPNDVLGPLPADSGLPLALKIVSYTYSIGWATFLMYYSMLLIAAPFVMYTLRSRYWLAVPVLSIALFLLDRHPANIFLSVGLWQIYFVIGLTAARFRNQISGLLNQAETRRLANRAFLPATALMLAINVMLNYPVGSYIVRLTNAGWLPFKFEAAYIHMEGHLPTLNYLLMNTRAGLLRPTATMMVATSAYLIYSKYEERLLRRTGRFILTMGRNTMAVFAAQAIAIPCLAAINLPHRFFDNLLLTSFLVGCMWMVARAEVSKAGLERYVSELKMSFLAAKNGYVQRLED